MRLRREHHRIGNVYQMTLEEQQYYAAAILDAACIPLGSALRRLEGRADRP
jgi:hypothetical protein